MKSTHAPDGILLLDKQPGLTSFDCIRDLKRLWNRRDLGHGGTLDKFASGLLPIFAGEGLKLARFFLENYPTLSTYWKSYTGTFDFGTTTETGDPEGAVTETRPLGELTLSRVQAAMDTFVGLTYEQMPPKYSAKKIAGERASDLAREGVEPQLKAASVTIKSFRCTGIDGNLVHFETECSKGTYVRVLAIDLARRLDTVAHLRALRRTAVGGFSVSQTLTMDKVRELAPEQAILSLADATAFLPSFELSSTECEQLKVGRTDLIGARLANSGQPASVYCARSATGPAALFELTSRNQAKFLRSFVSQE